MKKTSPKFAIGTEFNTTKAVLKDGRIERVPALGRITGVHDFNEKYPLRRSIFVYHVDVEGLDQPYGEREIEAAL